MAKTTKPRLPLGLVPLFQFGSIDNPWSNFNADYGDSSGQGLITLLNNLLKTATVIAGLYAFINILLAGYGFISANGDKNKVSEAWDKIWQTLLGLIIVAGAYILAGVFGYLVFNDPRAILNPRVYGP